MKSSRPRFGISIVELMIAITISLIVLVVMMQAFRRASGEIKKGRAMIEMASEMRSVGETFRQDLANATVSPRVWNLTSECDGYFEVVEGPNSDDTYPAAPAVYPGMSFFGDIDDIVALTIRSGDKPFRGRWVDGGGITQTVESHVAEVVWFVQHEDVDEADGNVDLNDRVNIYRRVLLVRPDLGLTGVAANMTDFFLNNDISARPLGANIQANTLSDLTLRENRYAHNVAPFPFEIDRVALRDRRLATGEDIMLTNAAGFDIRVYSPNAPLKAPNGEQFLEPGDPNWAANTAATTADGSYVDLGWGGTGWFANGTAGFATGATWCSWSPHYVYGTQAADGIDNNANGQVDEEAEMIAANSAAPYPFPVRALQLTMRGLEKSTRNVRQVSITSSFVPE
jgi:type II secretory pathway pseudopilin PulG